MMEGGREGRRGAVRGEGRVHLPSEFGGQQSLGPGSLLLGRLSSHNALGGEGWRDRLMKASGYHESENLTKVSGTLLGQR